MSRIPPAGPVYDREVVHCGRCGELTELVGERISSYSGLTGEPHRQLRFRCPNRRWWNGHTDVWAWPIPPRPVLTNTEPPADFGRQTR